MRAMLIANPKATSTTRRARELLLRAVTGDLDVEIVETARRGHAAELARRAAGEEYDVVIALGGDGTVNEIVNGLLEHGPAPEVPALAVLPCGSANVFARALGLPNDPVGAMRPVLDALRTGRHRTVGLGIAEGRYFTFSGGMGLDAEVVRAVEHRRLVGTKAKPALYVRTVARQFFTETDRRRPALTLERPGEAPIEGLFLALVMNTAPWTFVGRIPVNPAPRAHFSTGLDVFGVRSLGTVSTANLLARMVMTRSEPVRGPQVADLHDATEVTLRSARPIAFQLDGDYLGERECITFRSVPKAIRIVI